jgi:hypothetical protein
MLDKYEWLTSLPSQFNSSTKHSLLPLRKAEQVTELLLAEQATELLLAEQATELLLAEQATELLLAEQVTELLLAGPSILCFGVR